MVTYTWNNIVKYFETIADEHFFIKGFGSGFSDDVEINLEKNENYQFLGIIPRQVAPKEQTNEITVGMFVCDLVKTDQRNEAEVLSDTLQTFNDILKIFRNEDLNISLKGEPTIEPFKEKYSDNVAGWMGDIVLQVNYASNYCDIPSGVFGTGGTEGGEPQPGSDFITCETLSDCERIVSIVAELNDHEARITALEQGGGGLTCEDVANCQIVLDILGTLASHTARLNDLETAVQSLDGNIIAISQNLQGQIDANTSDIDQLIIDVTNLEGSKLDADVFMVAIEGYCTDTTTGTVDLYVGRILQLGAAVAWADGRSLASPFDGNSILVGAMVEISNSAGSNEATTLSVRYNNITDLQITSVADFSQTYHVYRNMAINQAVTDTDRFQLKIHGRPRVTNAIQTRYTIRLFFRPTA